jgi:hypothetical protein
LFSRSPGEQQKAETSTKKTRGNEEREDFGDGTYSGGKMTSAIFRVGCIVHSGRV